MTITLQNNNTHIMCDRLRQSFCPADMWAALAHVPQPSDIQEPSEPAASRFFSIPESSMIGSDGDMYSDWSESSRSSNASRLPDEIVGRGLLPSTRRPRKRRKPSCLAPQVDASCLVSSAVVVNPALPSALDDVVVGTGVSRGYVARCQSRGRESGVASSEGASSSTSAPSPPKTKIGRLDELVGRSLVPGRTLQLPTRSTGDLGSREKTSTFGRWSHRKPPPNAAWQNTDDSPPRIVACADSNADSTTCVFGRGYKQEANTARARRCDSPLPAQSSNDNDVPASPTPKPVFVTQLATRQPGYPSPSLRNLVDRLADVLGVLRNHDSEDPLMLNNRGVSFKWESPEKPRKSVKVEKIAEIFENDMVSGLQQLKERAAEIRKLAQVEKPADFFGTENNLVPTRQQVKVREADLRNSVHMEKTAKILRNDVVSTLQQHKKKAAEIRLTTFSAKRWCDKSGPREDGEFAELCARVVAGCARVREEANTWREKSVTRNDASLSDSQELQAKRTDECDGMDLRLETKAEPFGQRRSGERDVKPRHAGVESQKNVVFQCAEQNTVDAVVSNSAMCDLDPMERIFAEFNWAEEMRSLRRSRSIARQMSHAPKRLTAAPRKKSSARAVSGPPSNTGLDNLVNFSPHQICPTSASHERLVLREPPSVVVREHRGESCRPEERSEVTRQNADDLTSMRYPAERNVLSARESAESVPAQTVERSWDDRDSPVGPLSLWYHGINPPAPPSLRIQRGRRCDTDRPASARSRQISRGRPCEDAPSRSMSAVKHVPPRLDARQARSLRNGTQGLFRWVPTDDALTQIEQVRVGERRQRAADQHHLRVGTRSAERFYAPPRDLMSLVQRTEEPISKKITVLRCALNSLRTTMQAVGECSICLESLKRTRATALPCLHTFHSECISMWMVKSAGREARCPLCKAVILD